MPEIFDPRKPHSLRRKKDGSLEIEQEGRKVVPAPSVPAWVRTQEARFAQQRQAGLDTAERERQAYIANQSTEEDRPAGPEAPPPSELGDQVAAAEVPHSGTPAPSSQDHDEAL